MNNLTSAELAALLPNNNGCRMYHSIPMTVEQLKERRLYLTSKLAGSSFQDMEEADLDRSRYYEENGRRFFEDEEGRLHVLASGMIEAGLSGFRKANAEIPFEYLNVKTKDFDWTLYAGHNISRERNILNNYLLGFEKMKSRGMGLYIYSKTKGSGKTMLSCCLLNELANRYGCNIKFVNVLDLLEMTQHSYNGEPEEFDRIRNATVLCLDDIGAQMRKEWVDTVLYQLINERYTGHKVTLYTSNLPPDGLKIDERIVDRIEATTYTITLPEVNIRKLKSSEEKENLMNDIKKSPV